MRLVTFDSLPRGQGPVRIGEKPWLTLGGLHDNDSLELDERGLHLTATELASGVLVVGDHQRLKFFDPRGQLQRIVGRAGHGPGEFSSIRDLCPQRDSTLIVIDDDGRISHWSSDGDHLRTHERLGFIPLRGCTPDGKLLVQVSEAGEPAFDPQVRRRLKTVLSRPDGTLVAELGRMPAPEYFGQIFFEPGYAVSETGVLVGDSRTFVLTEHDLTTGASTKRWQLRHALRELSSALWDSLVDISVPRNASAATAARIRSSRERLGNPGVLPGFHRLLVDGDGGMWLSRYFDSRRWLVIDSGGRRLSELILPVDSTARPDLAGFTRRGPIVKYIDSDGARVLSFHDRIRPVR